MNVISQQLVDAALALSDEERLQIVEALVVSLQPSDRPPFDGSWRAAIERRSEELRTQKVAPVSWADVRRRAEGIVGG